MKKYLSLALILGMMLTLVGIIPAEAKAYTEYPYIYSDFENATSISDITGGSKYCEWVEGGAGGSKGALHIEQEVDAADVYFDLLDYTILQAGAFKLSTWVKLDTSMSKMAQSDFCFAFWAPSDGTKPQDYELDWKITNVDLNSGEWIYLEYIVEDWDEAMRRGKFDPDYTGAKFQFTPRIGNTGSGANVVKDSLEKCTLAADSPTTTLSWYLDDFKVEPIEAPDPDSPTATVSLDTSSLVNTTATFEYEYNSSISEPEGDTVIRVIKEMEDGEITLAQEVATDNTYEYVIPESAVGCKLRFEVIPVSDGDSGIKVGAISSVKTGKIKMPYEVTPTLGELEDGSITGSLEVVNNVPDSDNLVLMMAIVLYNEDGAVVGYNFGSASAAAEDDGESGDFTATANPELGEAVSATAFVWGGTSIFDTDMVSYIDPITVE